MDSEELELCRQELKEIEKVKFEKHLERIRKLSPHQKVLIDPEILKLAEI